MNSIEKEEVALRECELTRKVHAGTTELVVPSAISRVVKLDNNIPRRVYANEALRGGSIFCLVKNVSEIWIGAVAEVPTVEAMGTLSAYCIYFLASF